MSVTIQDTNHTDVLLKNLRDIDDRQVDIGCFDPNIAVYAAANEYGTRKAGRNRDVTIPERSFMRSVMDAKETEKAVMKDLSFSLLLDRFSPREQLKKIGKFIQFKIKAKINSNVPPPNAASTVRRKGHGLTLRDSYDMYNSIEYKVR